MGAELKLEQHMALNPTLDRREAIYQLYGAGGLNADEATELLATAEEEKPTPAT